MCAALRWLSAAAFTISGWRKSGAGTYIPPFFVQPHCTSPLPLLAQDVPSCRRYKTVAGADETSKLADGYYSDTTDDEETPSRLRNPVAKRKAIAGATEGLNGKNDTAFTYRDSSGNVLRGAGPK